MHPVVFDETEMTLFRGGCLYHFPAIPITATSCTERFVPIRQYHNSANISANDAGTV